MPKKTQPQVPAAPQPAPDIIGNQSSHGDYQGGYVPPSNPVIRQGPPAKPTLPPKNEN